MNQVFGLDTAGLPNSLGHYYDFYVNNNFYLLAPDYYFTFYAIYLNRCLALYDGWIQGWHSRQAGLVPQRLAQSVARGLNNMLFAHGIDFTGEDRAYLFATKWAKKAHLYSNLKQGHLFAIAGGTSLMKINRAGKDLFVSPHRIDSWFADFDANGKVVSARMYIQPVTNTNSGDKHYAIFEERYFNAENKACVAATVYMCSGGVQNEVQSRPLSPANVSKVPWERLPPEVKKFIKDNYPSIIVGKEQYLPFGNSLGLFPLKFTGRIEQLPNLPFGQPIGDMIHDESFQYDQLKYFQKNEVDMARARALVPEEYWNKDDPNHSDNAMSDRFFQKVSSMGDDTDKITPIQFALRANDIKTQEETILKSCSLKLGVSASSIASFLNEGSGAMTATQIINEKTKTDTWLSSQINLNRESVDDMLAVIMRYYNEEPVEIVFRSEEQTPFIERLKANSDVFSAGNMTAERFVRDTYRNLSESQQRKEIEALERQKGLQQQMLANMYKKPETGV